MAKNIYADFKKKLDRIENHIAEEVAPQANELLKESVRYSLIDWYNDYTPQSYERTYNFMKILDSTRTRGKGNVLRFSVNSGAMDNYMVGEIHMMHQEKTGNILIKKVIIKN